MHKLSQITTTIVVLLPSISSAQITMDYTTTVKVNQIELVRSVAANQIEKLIGKPVQNIEKEYSECTTNYEYSTSFTNGKTLKFEIFPEDNPQIKSENFYKTKHNFQQLGSTQGRVWLSWSNMQSLTETVLINGKRINHQYTFNQFKKDFPLSAKTGNSVLMLDNAEVKSYLKNPNDYTAGYTSYVYFVFKHGKLSQLEIHQGIAC